MDKSIRVAFFRLLALYLRTTNFQLGRWRFTRYAYDMAKRLGPSLGRRTVSTKLGFKMDLDLTDWLGQHVFASGVYEPSTSLLIRSLLETGDVVIDGGANVGFFTLLMARRVGSSGQVTAFEPVPDLRNQLLKNLTLNDLGNVAVRSEALYDREGTTELAIGPSGHLGTSSLRPALKSPTTKTIRVALTRLDSVTDPTTNVRLVKLDVEGVEIFALRGMRQVIQRCRPDLVIEISQKFFAELGYSPREVLRYLEEFGYRAFEITWDGLRPWTEDTEGLSPQFNSFFTVRQEQLEDAAICPRI